MKTLIVILAVLIIGGGLWYVLMVRPNAPAPVQPGNNVGTTPTPTPSPTPTPTSTSQGANKTIKVEMTAAGFSPKEVSLNVGDTVQFINRDTRDWWPASGMHPSHQICPGFDSLKGVKPGESYSHTFTKTAECPMHDHLKPSFFGKIIIK